MKTFAHFAGASLALALVGLMSGCASTPQQARHVEPVRDFEVVESSAPRPLTEKETAEVRASVASYLDREGATDSGDYYLKVYLTPQNADAEPEWVVVRFTRYTAERVVLVSDYGYADPYFSPYYSYDLYPYGYAGITTIAFQYYVDPYYGHHYPYYPRHNKPGGPHDDHHHDTANNHDGKPGHPPGNGQDHDHGSRPPPPKYYGNRPGVPPQNQNPPPTSGDTASTDDRRHAPRQGGGRADGRSHSSDTANGNNRPVPPRPEQTATVDQGARPVTNPSSGQRPEPRTISSRTAPVQTEARREPPANRPAPVYRAPSSDSGRSYQPAPVHSSPPPSSSTSSSSSNGDHRAADSTKQDNLR